MRYIVKVNAKKISDSTSHIFYYSGSKFTNAPTGVPSNTVFNTGLKNPISGRFDMFDKLTTYGRTGSALGSIDLVNINGQFDYLLTDYTINGQDVVVYAGEDSAKVFPDEFTVVQRCRATLATDKNGVLSIGISDVLKSLDKPMLPTKYLGNNVLPDGLEGTENDLKGKRKPRIYGKVFNVSPYFVNTSKQIYQLSDKSATVTGVFDRGVSLTSDGTYATLADLQNNALAPAASKYKTYSASDGTYIRLGSIPAGTVTVDAETSEKRCGELLKIAAIDCGILAGDISSADIAALNAVGYQCGVWATEDISGNDLLNQIASAMGVYFRVDRLGVVRFSRLSEPSLTASYTVPFYKGMIISQVSTSDTSEGVPAWSVVVNHSRNYTNQSDLAGTAGQVRSAFAKEDYRKESATDSARKTLFADSPEVEITTSLVSANNAASESTRYLSLLGNRQTIEATVSIDKVSEATGINVGDTIKITYPRFGIDSGKLFIVIGIVYDLGKHEITLRLWR